MPVTGAAVVIRHGERADYAGKPHWTRTSNRPWDPPLTEHGKKQAHLAGAGLKDHLKQHGLAKVTHVYCSPLVRCLETAEGLISGLGLHGGNVKIRVDPRLAETVCEAWYRSWGIRGVSDSTW
jgi:broad specificity phosphatase PhoE